MRLHGAFRCAFGAGCGWPCSCWPWILAGSAAYFGKMVFVNSYAENTLAGRFWFFGWIASMAALAGLLATVFARLHGWIRARQPAVAHLNLPACGLPFIDRVN